MKRILLTSALTLGLVAVTAGIAMAGPNNEPPPTGAILDLNGQIIPKNASQLYTTSFTATLTETAIAFAFRDDPGAIFFFDPSLVDTTTSSNNLLSNPTFTAYGIHTFDWVARAKPAAIEAKRAHPARMVFGPGGL